MPAARGLTRPLIVGRRFVLHGLSRLTIRVARLLMDELAEVVIVAREGARDMVGRLPEGTRVVWTAGDLEAGFVEAGLAESQ
ncbi:MAG: hypothetical protein ACRDJP_10850, partial [Actinomycetota bacterium]